MKLDILIVEDDILIALDLEDQVRSLGHRVTGVARDVESCRHAANDEPPDIALMDIRLAGGASGIEASKWLYASLGVRCIFTSGNLDDATREQLAPVRPVAFLGKPVLMTRLRRELNRACEELAKRARG